MSLIVELDYSAGFQEICPRTRWLVEGRLDFEKDAVCLQKPPVLMWSPSDILSDQDDRILLLLRLHTLLILSNCTTISAYYISKSHIQEMFRDALILQEVIQDDDRARNEG